MTCLRIHDLSWMLLKNGQPALSNSNVLFLLLLRMINYSFQTAFCSDDVCMLCDKSFTKYLFFVD